MGNFWSAREEKRIVMLGLDAAGKTSLLYRMKLGKVVVTIPTIGFNVESVTYKNINLTCWDVGGRSKIRSLWRHYVAGAHAFIFVIDSNDRDRIEIARDELRQAFDLEDDGQQTAMLVLANKQDLPNAMPVAEMTEKLQLNTIRDREWYIQGCSVVTGDGIYDGLDWIAQRQPRQATTNRQISLKKPTKKMPAEPTKKLQPVHKPVTTAWNALGDGLVRFVNWAL